MEQRILEICRAYSDELITTSDNIHDYCDITVDDTVDILAELDRQFYIYCIDINDYYAAGIEKTSGIIISVHLYYTKTVINISTDASNKRIFPDGYKVKHLSCFAKVNLSGVSAKYVSISISHKHAKVNVDLLKMLDSVKYVYCNVNTNLKYLISQGYNSFYCHDIDNPLMYDPGNSTTAEQILVMTSCVNVKSKNYTVKYLREDNNFYRSTIKPEKVFIDSMPESYIRKKLANDPSIKCLLLYRCTLSPEFFADTALRKVRTIACEGNFSDVAEALFGRQLQVKSARKI